MSIQVFNNDSSVAAKAAEQKTVEATPSVSADESAGQKQAEDKETSEPEAKEAKETDADAESSDEGDEVEAKDSDEADKQAKPKKKGGWQRQREKAEREALEAKRELEYWKSVALKNGASDTTKSVEQKTESKTANSTQEGEPDPDHFETHRDYVKALAKWEAKQLLKERDAETEKSKLQTQQQKLVQAHLEREKAFAEKTEDYKELVESIDDVMFPAYTQQLLLESDLGPDLIYELAKNRELAERISKLPYGQAAKEMGKLEARIAARSSEETKKPEPKKQTQAPAPISPVGSKGGKVTKDITDPNLPYKEYEAIRMKQRAARQSSW
jgi:hypothetical protein